MHLELTVPLDQSVPQTVNALLETAVDIRPIYYQIAQQYKALLLLTPNLKHLPMELSQSEIKL